MMEIWKAGEGWRLVDGYCNAGLAEGDQKETKVYQDTNIEEEAKEHIRCTQKTKNERNMVCLVALYSEQRFHSKLFGRI